MTRSPEALETVSVAVPGAALEAFEAAIASVCRTVAMFLDEESGVWTIEGVREVGAPAGDLAAALAVAELLTGVSATAVRNATPADGWLARTAGTFPEQHIGRRFAVRGTHLTGPRAPGRITLLIDASVAFGSGEHGSTRGCLIALERVARRPHRGRVLDLGTGSGILAMAAARLLGRKVMAADIDPWSVRTARQNARRNELGGRVRFVQSAGWQSPLLRVRAPYGLILANILARPLTLLAAQTARRTAPGGVIILAGLLYRQSRWVLAAYRRHGLVQLATLHQGPWTTLVLHRRSHRQA